MVPMTAAVVLAQGAPLQAQLDRIAWAQIVMAICMAVVTLALLGTVIAAFMLMRNVRRQVKALVPRAEPLLGAANKLAADATDLSGAVKERAEEVLKTVQELNGRLRELATETEGRVREFGAVLDVVQDEDVDGGEVALAPARRRHAPQHPALEGVPGDDEPELEAGQLRIRRGEVRRRHEERPGRRPGGARPAPAPAPRGRPAPAHPIRRQDVGKLSWSR